MSDLALVHRYHDALPWRIRRYLTEQRGIRDDLIDLYMLGWNGQRITIPIFDRQGAFAFFKLAKDPEDRSDSPKMIASPGARAELYGWERVKQEPAQIIICEGEFDRLVLGSHGFSAVTSTAGARVFKEEWAEALKGIPEVSVCFDRDEAGRAGALNVARLLPTARVIELPEEVGEGGDVTDFFVRLGNGRAEFLSLMEVAGPLASDVLKAAGQRSEPLEKRVRRSADNRAERVRHNVLIQDVVSQYVTLKPAGRALRGLCPFHEDHEPSLAVYPDTGTFYCFGCQKHGDVFSFLMEKEGLSFPQAVEALSLTLPHNGKA
ncbi:MAG: CHC2 zinc finger domain-containing protein [Acidobacteria bacterium]|nr:CHC2 zinc finger domain-containing protein [Acidobacteriota bacterium]